MSGCDGRHLRPVHVGGAHDGALGNLAVKARANRASAELGISPIYYDELLGRAHRLEGEARRVGLEATGIEASILDAGLPRLTRSDFVVFHSYSPSLVATGLHAIAGAEVYTMVYAIITFPTGDVYAIAVTLQPNDDQNHVLATLLFAELARSAAPGSGMLMRGRPAIPAAIEQVIRGYFAEHHERGFIPLLVGAELGVHAFEVSVNACRMIPMLVAESRLAPGDPERLVRRAAEEHPEVLEHRGGFVLAELFPGGIRFFEVYCHEGGCELEIANTRVVRRADRTGRVLFRD